MKRITLSLIALLVCCISMTAQQRSESEAMQIAQEFFGKKGKTPKLSVVSHQKVEAQIRKRVAAARRAPAQGQGFYVINDEASNRFIIVSADERMYSVLGYSDNNLFDAESAPVALLELMGGYERQYTQIAQIATEKGEKKMVEVESAPSKEISPLITSKWGQLAPFNALCPIDKTYSNDTLSATGCIATAMAQILNYWQHPTKCVGGTYYYFNPYNFSNPQLLYFNYNDYQINWSNLVDNYGSATEEQNSEVAKLMYACGVSVAMGYSADGSGSNDYNIPYALKHYFGYNPNIVYRNRDYYTHNEWYALIDNELQTGRPILYGGFNEKHKEGHEFIIDGYKDGLYHCNFGQAYLISGYMWSGLGDGFYHIDAVKPMFLGEQLGDWSYYQSMVCNITPETTGNREDTFYSKYFSFSKIESSYYFQLMAQCYSSDAIAYYATDERFNGIIGIGLFDKDFNYVKSLFSESVSMKSDSLLTKFLDKADMNANSLNDGEDYYIAPYALSDGYNIPTRMRALPPDGTGDTNRKIVDFYYKAKKVNNEIILDECITYVDDSDSKKIGDANVDGVVDVADIVYIVNYIMEKPADDFNFANADVDGDGVIDVADITLVVNVIMGGDSNSGKNAPMKRTGLLDLATSMDGQFTLSLTDAQQFVASQFDIVVPSAISISGVELGSKEHTAICKKIAPNRYRVVAYSLDNNALGDFLNIKTDGGVGNISIDNALFVTKSGERYYSNATESHTTGIDNVAKEAALRDVYTIDGRKINDEKLSKGVYIINNKKYIIK